MKKLIFAAMAVFMLFAMVGCGGGDDDPPPPPPSKYTVSFNGNQQTSGTAPDSITQTAVGAEITLPGAGSLVKTNFTFGGWAENAAGTGTVRQADSKFKPTRNITLYAKWNAASTGGTPVTISYDANGWEGTGVPTATATGTTGEVLGAAYPSLTSTATQIFIGWASSAEGDPLGAQYVIPAGTTALTLYVIWEAVIAEGEPITITYHANGWEGTGVPTSVGAGVSGTALTNDQLPVLTDTATQEFVGWALTEEGEILTITYVPHSNITLYVQWVPIGTIPKVIIDFYLDHDPKESEAYWTIEAEDDMPIGSLPPAPSREGFVFGGWFVLANVTSGGTAATVNSSFSADTELFARWTPDVLTVEDADEVLYLTNGSAAIYQFDIPEGKTLGDYGTITVEYKISNAALTTWRAIGARHVRLYGVYTSATPVSVTGAAQSPQIVYYNLSGRDSSGVAGNNGSLNNGYILDNSNSGDTIRNQISANTWFMVTYDTTGAPGKPHGDFYAPNLQTNATGTVYFGLGISCQPVGFSNSAGLTGRDTTFIQVVKNIKLNPKTGDDAVPGVRPVFAEAQFLKPAYTPGQFLANNDPIVYEWRADPTQDNIDNWRDLVPERQEVPPFDRGEPTAELVEVELHNTTAYVHTPATGAPVVGFTYINRGNPERQRGWTSFTEAGRANDQSYNGDPSVVAYGNFKEAWYLVVETTTEPTGTVDLVWMGGAGGWNRKAVTGNDGKPTATTPFTEITPNEAEDGFIIKIFLPDALDSYQKYYEENPEWAALALSYWGGSNTTLVDLGITRACLLLEVGDALADAKGIPAAFEFVLTDPPASGAVIDDVVLNTAGTSLTVSAAAGLTEYRWFVDGALQTPAAGITLAVTAGEKKTVTLQAKRGGKWVSQTVFITVGN